MTAKKALKKASTQRQRDEENPRPDDVDEEVEDDTTTDETETVEEDQDGDTEGDTEPGDENDEPDTAAPVAEAEPERIIGAPRDGQTFRTGDPVIIKGVEKGGMIVVQEPIYRAHLTPGSQRWRFHLLASKGMEISKAKVKEVGEKGTQPGTYETKMEHFG